MANVHDKPPRYKTYVLRCWEARSQHADRPATWRFSVEDAWTGEKRTFADLASVFAFLEAQINMEHRGRREIPETHRGFSQ
jgi:hypothetical protein